MELDELKSAWQLMNSRLEATEMVVLDLQRKSGLDKTRSALAWFRALPSFELLAGLLMATIYVKFISGSYPVTYIVSWVVLFLFNWAGIISACWQLATVSMIDFGGPVLQIQATLARVRAVREFTTRWSMIVALLLWVPIAIVFAQIAFRFDIVVKFGWPWVLSNLALGIVAIPVIIFLARRFGPGLSANPGVRRILDDVAGRSLIRAMKSVDELAEFEKA